MPVTKPYVGQKVFYMVKGKKTQVTIVELGWGTDDVCIEFADGSTRWVSPSQLSIK